VVGASLGCALASAATVTRHDGEFWKALRGPDKTAYVDGYHDAAQASLGKLDQLKVAASLFRWKGADKILAQLMRGLDLSGLSEDGLVAYLDSVYSNPQYGDFDVANAIELATMRGFDVKPVVEQKPAQPAPNAVAVGVAAEHR
jgi:hypothetical protein